MARGVLQMSGYYQVVPTRKQYISRSNPGRRSRPTVVRISNVVSSSQGPSPYWASVNVAIEAYLKKAIPIREPLAVFEPMRHLVLHAPPSLAPALCVAACEAVGGTVEQAMAAAAAVRLMHAAASAHDDLLSAHRPSSRPAAFEANIKLMSGDGIVPFGFELLAGSDQNEPDRVLRVMVEIARAVGSEGVVEGQYEEVLGRVDRAWGKKEGELHACAGACGAILGGGSDIEIEKLRGYGRFVGTIQGMVNWGEIENGEMVEKMKKLALSELKGLSEGKVEALARLVELDLCNV